MSTNNLALIGALLFSLHPVAVYAVGYLSQRSILMATLFSLLAFRLFLEGVIREKQSWLIASTISYFMAVHCKEHAIMVPAVCAVIFVLATPQITRQKLIRLIPAYIFFVAIAISVVLQVKSGGVLGQAYEPIAKDILPRMGASFDANLAYPLSVLTQTYLFFKYLLLWLLPNSSWMSVDMYEHFALTLSSWPEIIGLIGFIIYPIIAFWLLLRRGVDGLLGFALICPWLLFATELSSVRIQESFVLYRSYIWMPMLLASLPFLFQKLNVQRVLIYTALIAVLFVSQATLRLQTFTHPLLLWDDVIRVVEKNKTFRPGVERIYYNRGNHWAELKKYQEAIADQTKAIELSGEYSYYTGYAYQNRGADYLQTKEFQAALSDFKKANALQLDNPKTYYGIAKALAGLNNPSAQSAYQLACEKGSKEACTAAKSLELNANPLELRLQ